MADLPGPLLSALQDRYRVERELGAGGMATVYLAEDLKHHRPVALKVLHPDLAQELGVERFQREIEVASRLQHPHILTVHDSGEAAGLLWFTMPFVEGESLRDRLRRDKQLPVEDALRIAGEVADALDYAHHHGVIHRDIKPENILLTGQHAIVADFGISHVLGTGKGRRITGTGLAIGTPAYMSPEQASAERDLDGRTDVYSLGAVLYEMLAGEPPFTGPTTHAVLAKRFSGEVPHVRLLRPAVPDGVERAITKSLALMSADRFRTAGDMATALRQTATGETPAASGRTISRRARMAFIWVPIALAALGVTWVIVAPSPHRASIIRALAIPKSLAVLPFVNIGGDSATDYFSDGMSDELISALGRLPGLRVASRTSAFAFKGRTGDLREIGSRLGVAAVLEGSVRRDGPRVRVIARLVQAASDSQLWGEEYESGVEHVFAVQDSIAHAIVAALKLTLTGAPGGVLVASATADPAAHEFYLRGRALVGLRNPAALHAALDAFQSALARDPQYAAAAAGVADAYSLLSPFGDVPPTTAFPLAKAAALKALALDSTLAEVHLSLGIISMFEDWDWAAGERHLRRAIALNPNLAQAHLFYAWYLVLHDRGNQALGEVRLAQRLDPLSLIINTRVGTLLVYLGRDAEAFAPIRQALTLDSTFTPARIELAGLYAFAGRFAEAYATLPRPGAVLSNDDAFIEACVAGLAGRRDEARRLMAQLEAAARRQYVAQFVFAKIFACQGDKEAAFAALERAYAERSFELPFVKVEREFAPLRSDPRYANLIHRLQLP